jgi:hypothetical protein
LSLFSNAFEFFEPIVSDEELDVSPKLNMHILQKFQIIF